MYTYQIEGKARVGDEWTALKGGDFQAKGDEKARRVFYTAKRRPTFRLWKLRLMCDVGNGLSERVGLDVTRPQYRKEIAVETMTGVELQAVDYDMAAKYKSRAAKEHVSISPTANTDWFLVAVSGSIGVAGVAGMMRLSNSLNGQKGVTARIKGIYVQKEFRGQGIGTKVIDALERLAGDWNATMIEVYAYNRKFYEARGYEAVGTRPNGAVLLRRTWNAGTESK